MVSKLPNIEIRQGYIEDYPEIMEVADDFFSYNGDVNRYYCRDTFSNTVMAYLLSSEGSRVFVAIHNNRVVGYYGVAYSCTFSKRPILYEAHFAVHRDFVVSRAGRDLTQACVAYGIEIDALRFYAGATSGIELFDKSIINLYSKLGFKHSGAMMRYEYG